MRRVATSLAFVLISVTGCGSDSGISAVAGADLADRVSRIERAVQTGDPDVVSDKLLALEDAVSRWLDEGELSEARAARILAAATAVALRVRAIQEANPEPTPTVYIEVTETVTATPTESDDRFDDHPGKGHGKDHDEDD